MLSAVLFTGHKAETSKCPSEDEWIHTLQPAYHMGQLSTVATTKMTISLEKKVTMA